ncbi:hypothetical protein [Verrucomicrobium sp. BvORR106]|uniref:hypothetical protein n=1 Tax=Verrucomicrobium sp. BvORR106 TaxID=1403819 RepID=UPI00056F71D6|nr:hypothetical protein [Verrucomicrobium sp. BvORR106]
MKAAKVSLAIAAASALVGMAFLIRDRQRASDHLAGSSTPSKPRSSTGFAPVASQKSDAPSLEQGEAKRYRPEPVSEDVRLKVDALVHRLKDLPDEGKMRDPELIALMDRFSELLDAVAENPRLEKAMTSLMGTKGIDLSNPGSKPQERPGVQIPFSRFDDPVGRSWLEAVVSDDEKRVEDWIVNQFDGASFEFALDPDLKKTSKGITVTAPSAGSKEAED